MKAIKLIPLILALAGCSSGGVSEDETMQQDAEVVESQSEETARLEGYFKSAFNNGEVWECIRVEIRNVGTNNIHRYLSNSNDWAFSFNPESRELTSYTDTIQTVQGASLTINSSFNDNKGHYFRAIALINETPDMYWFDDFEAFKVRFADDKTIFAFYKNSYNAFYSDVRCAAREYSLVTVEGRLISEL